MARKTKLEAAATRDGILDAAEQLFWERGVSATSLQDIAGASGVTRGAIYWHFKDKVDLFNAMMERACSPFEQDLDQLEPRKEDDPLGYLHALADHAFAVVQTVPALQRVLGIAMHRVEYVGELLAIRDQHLAAYDRCVLRAEQALKLAAQRGLVRTDASARTLAIGYWGLVDGLLHNWVMWPGRYDLRRLGREAVRVYVDGLSRAAPAQGAALARPRAARAARPPRG